MKNLIQIFCLLVGLVCLPTLSYAAEEVSSHVSEQAVMKVNINEADAETIASALKGIGSKKAHDIVAYRKQLGGYSSVEQLLDVKGIGAKTLGKLRDQITL